MHVTDLLEALTHATRVSPNYRPGEPFMIDLLSARNSILAFLCAPLACEGCGERAPTRAYVVTDTDGTEYHARYCDACAQCAVGDGNMMGGFTSISPA